MIFKETSRQIKDVDLFYANFNKYFNGPTKKNSMIEYFFQDLSISNEEKKDYLLDCFLFIHQIEDPNFKFDHFKDSEKEAKVIEILEKNTNSNLNLLRRVLLHDRLTVKSLNDAFEQLSMYPVKSIMNNNLFLFRIFYNEYADTYMDKVNFNI